MSTVVRQLSEITDLERRVVEDAVGHPLTADQQVWIMVTTPCSAPDPAVRSAALQHLLELSLLGEQH